MVILVTKDFELENRRFLEHILWKGESATTQSVFCQIWSMASRMLQEQSAFGVQIRTRTKISLVDKKQTHAEMTSSIHVTETRQHEDALPSHGNSAHPVKLPFFANADPSVAGAVLNHVFAGSMARTLSQVGGHPIDTVKTRLQVKDPPKRLAKWKNKILENSIEFGPLEMNNWLFKGPKDLYRGLTVAVVGTVPNAFLYFLAYETSKVNLEKWLPAGLVHIASASIGTVVASVIRVPADTLKHKVQAYMHDNVFDAFRYILKKEGFGGLYRGFWPTLLRDIPEIVIQFSVYEQIRNYIQSQRKIEKLTTPEHLLIGAFAGATAATCTMPLDVIKTQQQCGMSKSMLSAITSALKETGPAGLFAGLGARAIHVSLMSALFFGLFEYCKLVVKPVRTQDGRLLLPKIWSKRRDKIWKRQFVHTD